MKEKKSLWAVVVSNFDDGIPTGLAVNVTNSLDKAKEYLESVYNNCINSINTDISLAQCDILR